MIPTDKETMPASVKLAQFEEKKPGFFALRDFAESVLAIMQNDKEWNADTLDKIALQAQAKGLAITNDEGGFQSLA